MKPEERRREILELLKRENGLPVQNIADYLGVSHMTVRRDVDLLSARELVRVIHGGVILSPTVHRDQAGTPYSLNTAGEERQAAKERIGERAASLIEPEDTLIIDSGSTTECLARRLPREFPFTVISYALNIVTQTVDAENVRAVFGGGVLHRNLLMFESPEGIGIIQRHRATKAFLSAAGVSCRLGVTCRNAYERATKRAAIESSEQRILLADSSKFDRVRSEYFADLQDFQIVLTDDGVPGSVAEEIREVGIDLMVV